MTLFNTLKVICFVWFPLMFISACTAATPIANSSLSTPIKPIATATPTSTHSPTSTPTTLPSSTPTPKPSPTWTLTPVPTATPYILPARSDLLPPITRDLVYLEDGQLKLWNHTNRQIMPLFQRTKSSRDITEFTISPNGQNIAFSRVIAEGYQLAWLNLKTAQITPLMTSTTPLLGWAISPNSQSIAYAILNNQPSADLLARQVIPTVVPDKGNKIYDNLNIKAVLYNLNLATIQSTEIGFISRGSPSVRFDLLPEDGFKGLVWSPDGNAIFWSDGQGIWSSQLTLAKPKLLLPYPQLIKPYGRELRVYELGVWSSQGRYLMIKNQYYDGSSLSIFDPTHGFIVDISDTYEYNVPATRLTWVSNNNLFAIRPGDMYELEKNPFDINNLMAGEIRQIEVLSQSLAITQTTWFSIPVQPADENIPFAPTQFEDGRLGFIIANGNEQNPSERGLYLVEPITLKLHKVNELPLNTWFDVSWNPDGSGAIISTLPTEYNPLLFYVPTDGSALYDLSPIISPQACCFTWLQK